MITIGTTLYGFCGGYFGESYGNKTVEGVGPDWIVVREWNGRLQLAEVGTWMLEDYTVPEGEQ